MFPLLLTVLNKDSKWGWGGGGGGGVLSSLFRTDSIRGGTSQAIYLELQWGP